MEEIQHMYPDVLRLMRSKISSRASIVWTCCHITLFPDMQVFEPTLLDFDATRHAMGKASENMQPADQTQFYMTGSKC